MSNLMLQQKKEIVSLLNNKEIEQRILAIHENNKNKADKFKANIINIALNKSLIDCTPQSIIRSAFNIADAGLSLNPLLGHAYIVSYKNKKGGGKKEAQPDIGYKGWLTLLERDAGKIAKAIPHFKCDNLIFKHIGFDDIIELEPNFDERKDDNPKWIDENLKGVIVSIKDLQTGYVINKYVSIKKIKQIAGKSPSRNSSFSPYTDWNLEMYMGKALKYVIKKMPMPEKIANAIKISDDVDIKNIKQSKETPELGIDDINDVDFEIIDEENEDNKPKNGGLLDDREG